MLAVLAFKGPFANLDGKLSTLTMTPIAESGVMRFFFNSKLLPQMHGIQCSTVQRK